MDSEEKKPGLEEMLESVEKKIARLEGGELSLDESFLLFEEGMKTLKLCNVLQLIFLVKPIQ